MGLLEGCGQVQRERRDYKEAVPGWRSFKGWVSMLQGVPLTGLHRPHGLCADFHALRALHGLGLLRRATVICFLHAAVALQGLHSWGCRAAYNQ